MGNVNIFHDALSFNTKEGGNNGGLSIHANGSGGGGLKIETVGDITSVVDTSGSLPVLKLSGIEYEPVYIIATASSSRGYVTRISTIPSRIVDQTTWEAQYEPRLSRMYVTTSGGIKELALLEGCGNYDPTTKTWSVSGTNTYPFPSNGSKWDVIYFHE